MRINNEVKLILTAEEAKWLKQIMQNPLYDHTPQSESKIDKEMRETFWITLNNGIL